MKALFSIFAVAVAAVAISCGNAPTKPAQDDNATIQTTPIDSTCCGGEDKCCGDSTKCCDKADCEKAAEATK